MGDVIQFPVASASRLAYSDLEQVTYEQARDGMKRIAGETKGTFLNYTLDAAAAYQNTMKIENRFIEPWGDELLIVQTAMGSAAVARYSHEANAFKAPVLILSASAHTACKEAANAARVGTHALAIVADPAL